ncbi:MAG TPA: RluA family pseudouridine synthase [Anaeromyxobacteraceae bacterium]|nr:RluA family pseudouridine synthase [Anaeromyxobacteraceae bacterium]
MRPISLRVGAGDAGARLDRFVSARGGISRGEARRAIAAGGVYLDGRRCKVASRAVRQGQSVLVSLEDPERAKPAAAPLDRRRILHLDEFLVAVDKPAFVPAQPTLSSDRGALPELVSALLGAPVFLVHRLDRETSGVTVFARSPHAAAALSEAFRAGTVQKVYLALTVRSPVPPRGRIDAPLGPDPKRPGRRTVAARGEPAATQYETLRHGQSGAALVRCLPETGRTHQIRAHLAHLGAPLLGDARYDGPRHLLGTIVPRAMLHSRRLEIAHPITGAPLALEAMLPLDFLSTLRHLVPSQEGEAEAP